MKPFLTLKIPNFRNYLLGAFLSEIGNQMQVVAVAWQVYEMTRNPVSLGLIGVANFFPIILFLFLISTSQSFSIPARQSVVPHLVPKKLFMNAVSLNTLQYQSAIMIGPAIAGFLIAGVGVQAIYLVNALSFIFFIIAIFSIKVPLQSHDREAVEFSLGSIMEGIRFVVKTPILLTTMVLDFLVTFFGTATILMPVFAQDVLQVGPKGLGLLYSAPAIGGVLAGLFISLMHHKIKHQGKAIIASIILYGLATIGFGFSKIFPLSILFLVLVGFGDMFSTIIRNTIRQLITPDYLRGRMASVMRIFFQGGPQLGDMEAGFLAKVIGGPVSVVVGGVGTVIITVLIIWKNKSLRNYTLDKD